jgi:hypothetical protein
MKIRPSRLRSTGEYCSPAAAEHTLIPGREHYCFYAKATMEENDEDEVSLLRKCAPS